MNSKKEAEIRHALKYRSWFTFNFVANTNIYTHPTQVRKKKQVQNI